MIGAPTTESFLVLKFREFYADVIRVRRAVLAEPWSASAKIVNEGERRSTRSIAARSVSDRLRQILDRQAVEAGREGGEFGSRVYAEARYVMAALADEIFLHLDWEGRDAWTSNLLETQLFGTHLAGDKFFDRLDALLRERDDLYRDLATVYLLALSLGFSGRHRGTPDAQKILMSYRVRLLAFIARDRRSILAEERHLFPQSYAHTLAPATARKLPHVGRWASVLALVCAIYLLVSHLMWKDLTADLSAMSGSIGGPAAAAAQPAPRTPATQ
jgi:type VI secretion system protein ImpK